MNIRTIENIQNRISASLKDIASVETIAALKEVDFILAEVRHFCGSRSALATQVSANDRLTQTLAGRYVKP